MTYRHGGNIKEVADRYGIEASAIIDFSANINPLGISPIAREAIRLAIDGVVNYPDNQSGALVDALSSYHGIAGSNILAGSGATELIYLIPRALKPKRSLIVAPAFSEYERALKVAGCEIDYFKPEEKSGLRIDKTPLLAAMERDYDMIWLASPSNPAGLLTPKAAILDITRKAAALGIKLIIDEAFIDYREEESIKGKVGDFNNLIVLRSMTKFFALAGLRVGYLFGHDEIIARLRNYREPWSVNTLGEAAAIASLHDKQYIEESIIFMDTERGFLSKELRNIERLKVYDSAANYILLKLGGGIAANLLQERLISDHRILIRDCGNYAGLEQGFIRVAVRNREENERLIEGLKMTVNAFDSQKRAHTQVRPHLVSA